MVAVGFFSFAGGARSPRLRKKGGNPSEIPTTKKISDGQFPSPASFLPQPRKRAPALLFMLTSRSRRHQGCAREVIRPRRSKMSAIIFYLFIFYGAAVSAACAENQGVWISVATHIDTTVSDGSLSLADVVRAARMKGVNVLIITDRDSMKWSYGLWPVRNLLKKTVEMNSVFKYGIRNYLNDIELESRKNKDLLIIPGIESSPYYRWEGVPFSSGFKILNHHKHILVLGLEEAGDYGSLPVIANKRGLRRSWEWQDLFSLWPVLTLVLGFVFLRRRDVSYRDANGRELGRVSKQWRIAGIAVVVLSALLLLDRLPYFPQAYDPYAKDCGPLPYQLLIDYANKKGALTFWAHPEAPNISERQGIKIETHAHIGDLYATHDYTGFSIFHEGYERAGKIGGDWDVLLRQYCEGKRRSPVWIIAGLAFDQGTGEALMKLMDQVQVFVRVPGISKNAVLEAMRRGRMYVSRGSGVSQNKFSLEAFSVEDEAGKRSGEMGESVRVAGRPVVCIKGGFEHPELTAPEVNVRLVRDGKTVREFKTRGRVEIRQEEDLFEQKGYFRLEIISGPQLLVTNPIFIEPQAAPHEAPYKIS